MLFRQSVFLINELFIRSDVSRWVRNYQTIVPLIHLFLQLPAEFVDPLLQPLSPLLWRQVTVILQGWYLMRRNGILHKLKSIK